MAITFRVALPGYDALTDTDPSHYSIFADSDNVLIKEYARGSGTVSASSSVTINHNLGYIPFYLIYGQLGSGNWQLIGDYTVHGIWKVYASATTLQISNSDGSSRAYKYFIFYDNLT